MPENPGFTEHHRQHAHAKIVRVTGRLLIDVLVMAWRATVRAAGVAISAAALVLLGGQGAAAQTPLPIAAPPQSNVTRILAIGSLTAKATPPDLASVSAREVPATLNLYLAGKIADWYAKTDQTGVVFVLNVTTVPEAEALLDPLPLGQAGMMTFQFIPLGPLRPLAMLLKQPAR